MDLKNSVNRFYFEMTINELRLMNATSVFPNITYNSLLYLDMIAYKERCTASFIAESMNVSKPAVTAKINELIAMGLITKTQSTEDKRINYLTLNKALTREYRDYDARFHGILEIIRQKYSKKEINTFCEILDFMSKSYSEVITNEQSTS